LLGYPYIVGWKYSTNCYRWWNTSTLHIWSLSAHTDSHHTAWRSPIFFVWHFSSRQK